MHPFINVKTIGKIIVIVSELCFISCKEDEPRTIKERIERHMAEYEEEGFAGSLLVVHKGEVLVKDGYGFSDRQQQIPNASNTVFDFGSLTKQFTGAAIVKAETLGLLSVEQKLSDFFPGVPEDKAAISLHQLLTHSSGFEDVLGDDYDLITKDEFLDLAFQSPLKFAPGLKYSYSNVGYSLLGIIIEQVSGQSYESFLKAHLFDPSGADETGYNLLKGSAFQDRVAVGYKQGDLDGKPTDKPWLEDGPAWHLRANGGILTTVEDMYTWVKALKEKKVLDDNALKKYLAPYVKEDAESGYYSYGWVVDNSTLGPVHWHDGGNEIFSAAVFNFFESDTTIIIASNDSTVDAFDLAAELISIISGV
jgi:CubicO group peptidase (beta-lactamase class C family)